MKVNLIALSRPNKAPTNQVIFLWVTLLILFVFFSGFYNPVLAAKKENSFHEIETALKENRSKYSITLQDIEERIATLKKIELLNSQQQSELSSLSQAHDFLHKSIESADRAMQYVESSQSAPQHLKIIERKLDTPLQQEELKAENIDLKKPLEKLEERLSFIDLK